MEEVKGLIQGISNWLLDICNNNNVLDYDEEIFLYGVEVIITTLINLVLLLIVGLVSGTADQAMVYFVSYAFLRKFIGGYHCNTNFKCITFNVSKYIIYVLICPHIEISIIIMLLIILFTLVLIVYKAPFEHKNRPISPEDKIVYKKYALIIAFIYGGAILLVNTYSYILLYVLVITNLSAIPCIIESYEKSS